MLAISILFMLFSQSSLVEPVKLTETITRDFEQHLPPRSTRQHFSQSSLVKL